MINKIIAVLFPLLLILNGCKDEEPAYVICHSEPVNPCGSDPFKTNLRIANVSQYDYCGVLVGDYQEYKNYGEILAGDTTCYISFDALYSAPSFGFRVENREIVRAPGEYIADLLLNNEYYICLLDVRLLNDTMGDTDFEIVKE